MPRREFRCSARRPSTLKPASADTTACSNTLENSLGPHKRDWRESAIPTDCSPLAVPEGLPHLLISSSGQPVWKPVRLENSGGQALAALGATSRKHSPAAAGGHACTKSVTAGALQEAWLKSTFHGSNPFRDWLSSALVGLNTELARPGAVR